MPSDAPEFSVDSPISGRAATNKKAAAGGGFDNLLKACNPAKVKIVRCWNRRRMRLAAIVVLAVAFWGCERKPCARDCEWHGLCTPKGEDCHAANDEDCRPSRACTWYGRCSAVDGKCATKTDNDCIISNKCKQAGQCKHRKGKCLAVRDSDCKKSEFCEKNGFCNLKRSGTCGK